MSKIRRNDEIIVIAGKDKGKRGKVLRVLKSNNRVLVEGVNLVKRHTRANPSMNKPGGIITKEAPVQISNIAIWNTETDKPDRVGYAFDENGNKQRIFKSSRSPINL
ncbi:MAG: 50S ribosomal protein L24 [Endozoicomonadaceae bacterium]|nr:50S ribosomal protein L24 [Endozoicomonadaceae bacterium]